MADKMSNQTLSDLVTGPKPAEVTMGNRTAQVYKYDSDGRRIEDVTPEDAARAAIGSLPASNEARQNPIRAAASWFGEHLGNVAGTGAYGIDRIVGPALRAVGVPVQSFDSIEQAQEKGRQIAPSTPASVALTLATANPTFNAIRAPARVAAGAGIGAGAEAAGGGGLSDVASGAGQGVLGTTVPQGVARSLQWVTGLPQRFITESGLYKTAQDYAGKVLRGMSSDVPELAAVAKGTSAPEQLLSLRDPAVGRAALGSMMETAEKPIVAALPNARFVLPGTETGAAVASPEMRVIAKTLGLAPGEVPPGGWARYGVQPSASAPKAVGIEEALATLKALKAKARDLYTPENPALSYEANQQARLLQEDIRNVIAEVNPKLATAWDGAMGRFHNGLQYIGLIRSGVQGAESAGTPFDIRSMMAHYLKNYGDMAPSRMPGLHAALRGAGQTGAQPTITDPALYARVFGGQMAGHVAAHIPSPKFISTPGVTPGVRVPVSTVAPGLISLGDTVRGQQ